MLVPDLAAESGARWPVFAAAAGRFYLRFQGLGLQPIAFAHTDPELPKLRRTYGWRSEEVQEHLKSWPVKDVPGIRPIKAADISPKTAHHNSLMSMFERLGFERLGFEHSQRNGETSVVMRLKV